MLKKEIFGRVGEEEPPERTGVNNTW